MITKDNTVVKITSNDLSGLVVFDIAANQNVISYILEVSDNKNIIIAKSGVINKSQFKFEIHIQNPILWNLSSPFLYEYSLKLNFNNHIEDISERFGIRKISTNKKYVCINDHPIFIKGYIRGATAHEHSNNINVSEEEFYRKNIQMAKKYGFNLVRFHSQIPSEIFFKVADEEGLLVHIEMRPPHDLYNNLEEMVHSKDDFISESFIISTIDKLYNHPSLMVYCLGNEIRNLKDSNIVTEIGTTIKKLDPTRLYLDTCAWGENNRPLVDIDVQHLSYFFPFGKHSGMYDDTNNLMIGEFNKGKKITFNVPLIAHEVCHYTALRDFKHLKEKFIHYGKNIPWWVDAEINLIHDKGYDNIYDTMYVASKTWQLNCWKVAFEEMRNSKLLGGFHFLQFADTDVYENSNGIVDCFDDPTFSTPTQFLMFNGDMIVTAKITKYNYYEKETINIPINISRFDEYDIQECTLEYSFYYNSKTYSFKEHNIDISKHDHYQIFNIHYKIPASNKKTLIAITLKITNNNKVYCQNEYQIWAYPRLEKLSYNQFINICDNKILITDNIEKCFKGLEQKKNVCLIYRSDYTRHVIHKDMTPPKYAFKASWHRYKPVIWDRGTNFGGYFNISNFTNEISNNLILGNDYCCLLEDSDKIFITSNAIKFSNWIAGIDKCNRDRFDAYKGSFNLPELMPDRTLRNYSHLFETKIDEGNLLVTGLNFLGLDNDEPSSNYLAHKIINYLKQGNTSSVYKSTLQDLKIYMQECAKEPLKERMMTQFWTIDTDPVESKKYWEDSRNYLIDNKKEGSL